MLRVRSQAFLPRFGRWFMRWIIGLPLLLPTALRVDGAAARVSPGQPEGQTARQVGVAKEWLLLRHNRNGDHCIFLAPPELQKNSHNRMFVGRCDRAGTPRPEMGAVFYNLVATLDEPEAKPGHWFVSFIDRTLTRPEAMVRYEDGRYTLQCDSTQIALELAPPALNTELLSSSRFVRSNLLADDKPWLLFRERDGDLYFYIEMDMPLYLGQRDPSHSQGQVRIYAGQMKVGGMNLLENMKLSNTEGQLLFVDGRRGSKLKFEFTQLNLPPARGFYQEKGSSAQIELIYRERNDQTLSMVNQLFAPQSGSLPCDYQPSLPLDVQRTVPAPKRRRAASHGRTPAP